MGRVVRCHWTAAVVVFVLTQSAPASAQAPSAKAAAQGLFDEAIKLMSAKSYAAACPKLEESERLEPAMGTRYQLAQCYEAVGRMASAWAAFLEVADLARASGQTARETAARRRASDVEPKVSHLVIDVETPPPPGLEVQRDGIVVGAAQWGSAVPVDPGPHHVVATRPSRAPWTSDTQVAGDGDTVHVRVPTAPPSSAPVPVIGLAPPASSGVVTSDPPPASSESHVAGTAGLVTAAAGVLAMGAGVVIGVAAHGDYISVGNECTASGCNAQGKSTTDSARQLGNIGTVTFVAGAALAAGGGLLWLLAPRGKRESGHAFELHVGPGSAWASGSF